MKMKKMVGALALTAALAMGTAPAFAAGASASTETDEFSDNGSTEVKAVVDNVNPQVRATVPLQVTVVFGTTGASDIIGPSAEAYKITNVGQGDIKVTEAEITNMNSIFTNDPMMLMDIEDEAVEGDNIMFYYTTAENHTYLTAAHPLSSAQANTQHNRYIENAKAFTAEVIAPDESVNITLGGKAYFNSTISNDQLTDTLCNIKYTIAAA